MPVSEGLPLRPMPRTNVIIYPLQCGLNPVLSSSHEGASYEVGVLSEFLEWLKSSRYTVGEMMEGLSHNGSIVIRGIGGLTLRLYTDPFNYCFTNNIVMAVGPEGATPTCNRIELDASLHAIWRRVVSRIQPSVQLSPMSEGTPQANGPFPPDAVMTAGQARPRRAYEFIESLNLPVSNRKVTHNQPELCDRFAMLSDLSDYGIGVAEVRITLRDGSTRTLTEEGILDEVVVSRRSEPSQVPPSYRRVDAGRRYGSGTSGEVARSTAPGEVVWVDEAPQSAPSFDQILDTMPSPSEGTHES